MQIAKIQQNISAEEIKIDVAIRRKLIEVEEKEVIRKEKELISTVKLPVEAESYKVETVAEGNRFVDPVYDYYSLICASRFSTFFIM